MRNIKTRNTIFFNLTDGEAYASLGLDNRRFDNQQNAAMRIKYLRGENELTMIIGNGSRREHWVPVYGENVVMAGGESFETEMFRILMRLLDTSYE